MTGERLTGRVEETKHTTRLETKEVEGESVDDRSGGGSGVIGDDSGTINEHGDSRGQKNNNGGSNGVGSCVTSGVSGGGGGDSGGGGGGGGLSCRGSTLRLLRGLVEGPIGRVAARVHRWGTAGGVNPSAPSGRECPGGEGTPRRNVLDATKNRRLMGANLTKQSRVSRSRGVAVRASFDSRPVTNNTRAASSLHFSFFSFLSFFLFFAG